MNDNITVKGELDQAFTQDIADAPYWNRDQDDDETDGDDDDTDTSDTPDSETDADDETDAAETETEHEDDANATETEETDEHEHKNETEPTSEADSMKDTGETVSGTSADDLGSEATTTLPEGVEAADLTETQRAIIDAWLINRTASSRTIAERVGCSRSHVSEVLTRFCDHSFSSSSSSTSSASTSHAEAETEEMDETEIETKNELEKAGTAATWKQLNEKSTYEDLTAMQQRVVDALACDPERTNAEIAAAADCSTSYISPIRMTYSQLIDQRRNELGERDETNRDSDSKSECEDRDAAAPASGNTDAGETATDAITATDERRSSEIATDSAAQPTQVTLTDERFSHEFPVAARAIKATAQHGETERAIDHLLELWATDRAESEGEF